MSIKTKCFSKSVTSVILSLCMIFSCISVSLIPTGAAMVESESVGTTVPVGKTFYLDVTNFSGDYNSGYYMSLSGNGSTTANKDDTTGVPSYVPKNDSSWVQMTQLRGNIYKGTTTAESTNGRISFWSKNGSSYDNVWEMNVSLGNSYDESKNMFVVSSGKTTHDSRRTDCFSGTWESYMPDIYFLNNHGWSNVYVLLFNDAQWNDTYGVQAKQNVENASMTRVGNTDVYKFSPTKPFTHVAFVKDDQNNYDNLYQTEAAYASGCSESHPLYIPGSASKTVNQTVYYNADGNGNDINGGYWTSYSEGDAPYSGMSLYIAGRFHVRTIDTGNQWINSFDTGLTLDPTAATNPEVSENVYTYHYVMGDAALNANPTGVNATVTLAAKAPEITDVQVKGKNFDFDDPSSNTFDIYYLQPLVAKATANTFTQLSYTDAVNTQPSASSGTAVTLAASIPIEHEICKK